MQIYDSIWMRNAIEKMADAIIRLSAGRQDTILAGIRTRGPLLAKRVADVIGEKTGSALLVGAVDIRLQRDDFHLRGAVSGTGGTDLPAPIDGREVILIDDVLFTGRTVRAALNELLDHGRASAVRLAVLIDRGGRELPVQPDVCVERMTVPADKTVAVRLKGIDAGDDCVLEL